MVAKLSSIKPGRITIKLPTKPIITADHLRGPTFSSKKIGESAATIRGAINANVKAYLKDGNSLFHLKQPHESTYLYKETIFIKFV